MITIKNGRNKNVPCCIDQIGCLAFNGCSFAMTSSRYKGIVKLNKSLCPVETVHTNKKYTCLCFDMCDGCYWASAEDNPFVLYRLDSNFRLVGKLNLSGCCKKYPCGISCTPCCSWIIAIYPDSIAYVDKNTGKCRDIPCEKFSSQNLDVLALCDGYMVSYIKDNCQYIDVHCSDCGENAKFCIPKELALETMLLQNIKHDEKHNCITYEVILLFSKKSTCKLLFVQLFITCCEENPHFCKPDISCECGKYEIMHSIALEEAGIAHILNAEGEKIQEAVAGNNCIEDLLKINESVRRTIAQVTQLEGVLLSKLESLNCICDDEICKEPFIPCNDKNI